MIAMRFERMHLLLVSAAAALFLIVALSKHGYVPSIDTVTQSSGPKHKPGKPLTVEQRMERSEKSYLKQLQDRKKYRAEITPDKNFLYTIPKWNTFCLWDLFVPSYTCPWDLERIGHLGDGGKWICGFSKYVEEQERELIVYSFGVNQDSSFEESFLTHTNARVWAVDYSVDSFGNQLTAEHKNRSTFMKVGLDDHNNLTEKPPFYTLKSLMEKNGHNYIDYLKIDVEGAEYKALSRFMEDFGETGLPFGQLALELHLMDDAIWDFSHVSNFLERLESFGLRIVANEVNYGSASTPPRFMEYVWVNTRDPKSLLWRD